ncbi:MAG: hypothetical protein Q7S45_02285 [Candidatus Curtissbacteria bacterium]|nr:hypothetical protein [Candidatus Curtissbacteria bacterium]
MYVQVVVLTYQSPDIDSYTYEIPKNLNVKIGQLVSIPFGKRNPQGIIVGFQNQIDPKIKTKPIASIILDQPILLAYQIDLLKWMSSYYLAPMANCLDAMLPKLPNAKTLMTNAKKFQGVSRSSLVVSQTLVLVPNIDRIPETLANFPQAKNYVLYHNQLKASEKFAAWQKIMSGQCDFIFGSRSAIFAPNPNLKKICIYDEHDSAYKDERSPYFDTLTIAEKISELTKAKIEIIDSSPRITTFTNHGKDITFSVIASVAKQSQKQIAAGSSSPRNDKADLPQTKTIDMTNEKVYGNYSPISQTLEEILKRAAAKKLSTLLFLNKKSESGSIYCKSCKAQTVVQKQIAACPNCGSPDVYFNLVNINSLSAQVKKILPGAAIDIETAAAFYKLLPKKYDVAVHIKTDSVLNFPDFASSEKLYAQITNLKKLAKKLVILQTYNPDHPAIKWAIDGNYLQFYKEELSQRKTFSYPPFSLLVKIVVAGTEEKAQEIFDNLDPELSALGPIKDEGNSKYNIILKIKLSDYSLSTRTKTLDKVRVILPHQKDVRIIVEPDSII